MLGFSAPALLWGTGAILVPVAIHFWSHRPARVIRVGSIRLLAETMPARARRVALTDVPLLLLRAAIVLAVALAAAGLGWFSRAATPRDLALLDPSLAAEPAFARLRDSLGAAGVERRWLAPELPALGVGAPAPTPTPVNVWPLLAEADARFGGSRLVVAAARDAARYRGARPALVSSVRWLPVASSAAPASALARAPRRVLLIVGAGREKDARYAEAALQALAATRAPGLELQRMAPSSVPDSAVASADAIVALGAPLDSARIAGRLRMGARMIADSASWPHETTGEPHWRSPSGDPAVTRSPLGKGTLLRLRSRALPASLPLVATAAFADSLGDLLLPAGDALAAQQVTDAQRTPERVTVADTRGARTDLVPLLALLALTGFLAERLLARRRKP